MVRACSTSRLRSGLFSYLQIPAVRVVLKDTNDRFPANDRAIQGAWTRVADQYRGVCPPAEGHCCEGLFTGLLYIPSRSDTTPRHRRKRAGRLPYLAGSGVRKKTLPQNDMNFRTGAL